MPCMNERKLRSQNDIALLVVVCICAMYVLALAFIPGFRSYSPLVCLWRRSLGLYCPACGLTRAVACCVRLDFANAVRFNPLVVIVVPVFSLYLANLLLRLAGLPGLAWTVPPSISRFVFALLIIGVCILFSIRTVTWLMPDANPDKWLMPPSAFPGD
jgi:hypothetical protein